MTTRCGLVALVGLPNAGKSTLMNALMGEKVGIVSPKANTTRLVVRGIVAEGEAQLVLVDTPGLNSSAKAFDRLLVQQARGALDDADVVCLVVDAARGLEPKVMDLIEGLKQARRPVVLVLNKVDLVQPRAKLLPLMQQAQEIGIFKEVFAVDSLKEKGLQEIIARLARLVPEGPWLFPAGMATDVPLPLRLAEITREKAMFYLQQEVPYGVAVLPVEITDVPDEPLVVVERILVSAERYKGMVIGAGGQMLKKIGSAARQDMQEVLGRGVRLELEVQVEEGWMEKMNLLRELGVTL